MKAYRTLSIFEDLEPPSSSEHAPELTPSVRRGPPNRMNDLPYRDWMKFQKSFFRFVSAQAYIEECIGFFTKAIWDDGKVSRSLVIGSDNADWQIKLPPRMVEVLSVKSIKDMSRQLHRKTQNEEPFDFILLDLREFVPDRKALGTFLDKEAESLFKSLRKLLVPQRYCGVMVDMETQGSGGFPLPWAVAQASRKYLKLRDEKIGLVEATKRTVYCLFMQGGEDGRAAGSFNPDTINMAEFPDTVPAWIIPKPPPRKKNEVLHPAKYPETLVAEFISQFTQPEDWVLDPMVGSGSTVVAAINRQRNSVGIDLSEEFTKIARKRATEVSHPTFFETTPLSWMILLGDSTQLCSIPAIAGICFRYCVTSPPYWSMLNNPGSENQENRRQKNLPLVYSQNQHDLGNIEDYDQFLALLVQVYTQVAEKLMEGGCLTVVVKNVKRNHILYPLAWDLTMRLCGQSGDYEYLGTTLWCQDDVGLKPFAVGIHWVSNILHHYCLHFRKREK